MTRWLVWLVAGASLAAALLARGRSVLVTAVVAIIVGLCAGAVAHVLQARRVGAVSRKVDRWRTHPGGAPLHIRGGSAAWRSLTGNLEALRAAHDEALLGRDRTAPWRDHLVQSVEDPALIFGAGGRLAAANEPARQLLSIPGGGRHQPLLQVLGSPALVAAVREARPGQRPISVDVDVKGRELRATTSAIGEEVLLILADRTEQRRVEELRRDFVVNASHELKTPATAIQTLSEALEIALERDPGRIGALVPRLREESERLVRLVHDLLDLRRLEEPRELEWAPVDLAVVTAEVVAEHEGMAAERGVSLRVELPPDAVVAGVAGDLRLVVANLIANAVQYNREGGRVDVVLRPDDGAYVLEVRDTGIGIPTEDVRRIFERFYRVDTARSRAQGGTGLGLAIVRHAVERHGGTIAVESLLSEGSTFRVRLPIEPAP